MVLPSGNRTAFESVPCGGHSGDNVHSGATHRCSRPFRTGSRMGPARLRPHAGKAGSTAKAAADATSSNEDASSLAVSNCHANFWAYKALFGSCSADFSDFYPFAVRRLQLGDVSRFGILVTEGRAGRVSRAIWKCPTKDNLAFGKSAGPLRASRNASCIHGTCATACSAGSFKGRRTVAAVDTRSASPSWTNQMLL